MISEDTINILIKARKEQAAIYGLQALSITALVILIALEVLGVQHNLTIFLATLATIFMCGAVGQNRWVSVSRGQLVKALEQLINNDANAVERLAEKNKAKIRPGYNFRATDD
ncbi:MULTISPECIES: hypothetical protein [Microbulbifer]|uniref:hypothetical protein n=1 Tax=Microbulbifer TaxID=48073 RepID=UPI001E323935|nr:MULTISPECIES: hypothetical protein [Microbulbifer]UHQ53694.1 hypothetical protein LVE68_09215 [Microbulbifer sp. YPW16]